MDRSQEPEFDISTGGFAARLRKYLYPILLLVILLLSAVLYFLVPDIAVLFRIFGFALLGFIAFIVWFLVRRGAFTWMRLASQPAELMACGEAARAELVFARALDRAWQFAPADHRRGLMLCELAMFAKHQGRYKEALAMYEESVGILAHHDPADYFTALNNYGIVYIGLKNFDAAQRILEKAIDLSFQTGKYENGKLFKTPAYTMRYFQFIMHLNLAVLLIDMDELEEAELQLHHAESSFQLLPMLIRGSLKDKYFGIRALWQFSVGNYSEAEKEILKARKPFLSTCLWIRARLHLVRKEFEIADRLLQKYLAEERKKGSLHRPDHLNTMLDLAEAQFGQAKYDDAFASFQEARSIVADFALPADAAWRKPLATWRQRAIDVGRTELAASLDAELAVAATMPIHSITILDRFRVFNTPARLQ